MTDNSQVVLITGCSTGIGRATATRLAAAGHTVYATARRESAVADLAQNGCRTMALDVTDEASMRTAVDKVLAEHGAVGALVNNAGYSQSGAVEALSMADLHRQFETNVFGLVRMCQLVLPGMRERGSGRIVNLSSMGANFTFPGGGAYHASKYAVEAISDALRFEVKGFGVKVVIIQPGLIRTDFSSTAVAAIGADEGPYGAFNAGVAQATKDVYEKGPMAHFGGDPDDVAKAIEKAITARRPKIRMRVTPSAHMLIAQRRMMTDGMWDRFLTTQFTAPRPDAPAGR
ncbi:MAG: short-chain dehydrogenase/reductase [Mycobacterium sp.]|uniref:SDR family NAD(P)-dependent oxidoreductase n=1 Tax=Mycobacterium sp. TaxID=1785 RepID=UPI000CB00BF5|nr:SDR family NAD(P)-dependent oxidoreductase [Mycobacterium sp.]PJE01824.1 MAG: short-chain dehydrogenase/reductase [Mycobacterium sp.]PJE04762.1 MAG: short-chain dehydrogenase/reductase [Mycobacterium sp.]